ncbi:hypothetical protein A0J61_07683 [Choanephora cucurbitarum]|uniref:ATP-dependent DNA helicase n=1 Tax=Choanephora cucurbitarum TaxID=101091 RepID=A0A1C7N6N9_9FUNG|nr:hypothetical protein A0J61_07683 [Choanephora cucurbitarum]
MLGHQEKLVIFAASSVVASVFFLLPGGPASHSRFRASLNALPDLVCLLKEDNDLVDVLKNTA